MSLYISLYIHLTLLYELHLKELELLYIEILYLNIYFEYYNQIVIISMLLKEPIL